MRSKNKFTVAIVVLLLQTTSLIAQDISKRLDTLLTVYTRQYKFNGMALVAKEGKILLEKGYGFRDVTHKTPNDSNSIFQIGSITKQFTATVILYLQEKEKLNVKDKLIKYIPDYPGGNKISLENLLTHTSGIYNYTNDNHFMNNESINHVDLEKAIALFKNKPLEFEPGTKFSYSNSNYLLLGYIIQKVSGKPYEQMVREVIFQPLRMEHSGFDFKNLKDPNKAVGYLAIENNLQLPAPIVDSSASFSAGAIYTTVGDLYKWHKALYTDKVISQASLEKAFTPFLNKYGYGWMMDSLTLPGSPARGKRIITHNGGIFGFTADMLRIPSDDVCIILLCNKSANLTPITRNLMNILYGLPYEIPAERKAITLAEDVLQQYVGEYWISNDYKVVITLENGQLKGQVTGQPKVDLFAQRKDLFFLKVIDAQIEFMRDASAKIEKLVLYQGSVMAEGKKMK